MACYFREFIKLKLLIFFLLGGAYLLLIGGCAETALVAHTAKKIRAISTPPVAKGYYKVGTPYKIKGVWYYPKVDYSYDESGIGSWYGPNFHQKLTANGEIFDQNALSAAHRTLPMPSVVRVTNLQNGRALVVRINDRGPFAHGRIIDLSRRAAQLLGFKRQGIAKMRVELLPEETKIEIAKIKGEYKSNDLNPNNSAPVPNAAPIKTVSIKSLALVPGTTSQKSKNPIVITNVQKKSLSGVELTRRSKTTSVQQFPIKDSFVFVQAAAFSSQKSAANLKNKISDIGEARVYKVLVNGKTFYRVRIGPFTNTTSADKALTKLIKKGFPGARIVVSNKK